MARIIIDLPERFDFVVDLPIFIGHINRGDHLGNDAMIGFLNEARVRFMAARGVPEFRADGALFINADLAVSYKSEGRYGETLRIEVGVSEFHKYGCDIVYRVSERDSGRLIALAKTAHLVFDAALGRPVLAPPELRERLLPSPQ